MTQPGQRSRAAQISAAQSQAPAAAKQDSPLQMSPSAPFQGVTVQGARVLEVLALSGERLTRAEELLLRPTTQSIAELIHTLEQCCEMLSGLDAHLSSHAMEDRALDLEPDRAALAGAARQWRRSLQRLAHLTAGASSFCNGWASMAGYLPAYTPSGAAPSTAAGGSQLDRLG